MSADIYRWLISGNAQRSAISAAKQNFLQALEQWRADQRRFDQSYQTLGIQLSWSNEAGLAQHVERAELEGNTEQVARLKRTLQERRIAVGGWKLALYAAIVNLRLSIDSSVEALNQLTREDAYCLDRLAGQISAFLRSPDSDGFDETDRPLVYHMDTHQLRGIQRDLLSNKDAAAIEETYRAWLDGTWHGSSFAEFSVATKNVTFVSWRTCQEPLVGCDLLPVFTDLLRRLTRHGPDRALSRMPEDVEHAYQLLNEPQYDIRRNQLRAGTAWERNVEGQFLNFGQDFRRAEFIAKVEELQAFCKQLRDFNERLLSFIDQHRRQWQHLEATGDRFVVFAAKHNLLAAVSVSASVTRMVEKLQALLLDKYLPRADKIRPLLDNNAFSLVASYSTALESLCAHLCDEEVSSGDKIMRAGRQLIQPDQRDQHQSWRR